MILWSRKTANLIWFRKAEKLPITNDSLKQKSCQSQMIPCSRKTANLKWFCEEEKLPISNYFVKQKNCQTQMIPWSRKTAKLKWFSEVKKLSISNDSIKQKNTKPVQETAIATSSSHMMMTLTLGSTKRWSGKSATAFSNTGAFLSEYYVCIIYSLGLILSGLFKV